MTDLYWLQQTIAVLPLALWVYLALGIPYALLALPRPDWRDRPLVAAIGFAFGPALLTAWMFILGVAGGAQAAPLMRFDVIFAGTVVMTTLGWFGVWRKAAGTTPAKSTRQPLHFDETFLLGVIGLAVITRAIISAFWTFTAYDALWVYGYQGRLYTLLGYIPQDIGYYPQFLQLQFAFMQLFGGAYDDYAARIVLPFLQVGAILAAYVLGSRLFNRRTGILLAAIWTLYPHVAMWSHVGDLEIPLAFLFTLTAALFLMAWMQEDRWLRRRYALIAGLLFGIAMWTKPTAGAFVWGVVVLVVIEFVRVRGNWRDWWPRFEVAAITGLACIPLGAAWYLRNILLGLPPIEFPPDVWLTLATRSGDLFGWPLLAVMILLAYLVTTRKDHTRTPALLIGILLVFAGLLPSNPQLNPSRANAPASYLQPLEVLLILIGAVVLIVGLLPYKRPQDRRSLGTIGWAYALALPYFLTWFYSYSYHARLSFAIVPLLILPSAALLAAWIHAPTGVRRKIGYVLPLSLICLPLLTVSYLNAARDVDWFWSDALNNDAAKYLEHAPGVFQVASHLSGYEAAFGEPPRVVAPGEQRLGFFLPHITLITDTVPTTYEELGDATHYVYGDLARWRYENDEGIDPLHNQIVASLNREEVFTQTLIFTDGNFHYELYDVHLEGRFPPQDGDQVVGNTPDGDVVFGGFARYLGADMGNWQLLNTRAPFLFAWEVLDQTERNYHLRLTLINQDDGEIYGVWEAPFSQSLHSYYNSQLWDVGELILEDRFVTVPRGTAPPGINYELFLDFVDAASGETATITVDGAPIEGGLPLNILPLRVGNPAN